MANKTRSHGKTLRTVVGYALIALLVLISVNWTLPVQGRAEASAVGASTSTSTSGDSLDMGMFNTVLQYIRAFYYYPFDSAKLSEGAVRGLVQALGDDYSEYLTAQEYSDMMTGLGGTFGGLGIYIETKGDYVEVVSPIKGTPAWRAGLQPGDKIAEVDGKDFRGKTATEATQVLRGAPGTSVKLGILRKGMAEIITITITREIIVINPVEYEMKTGDIGLITLSSFNEHTTDKMNEALADLKAKGAKALILDLRNDPGGLLDQAVNVADMFLNKDKIVLQVVSKNGTDQVVKTSTDEDHLPMVVLVNKGSASASEILTAALKENGTATVIGEQTYGKGSVQTIYGFSNGAGLKITTANYLSPQGHVINHVGVAPDIVVPMAERSADETAALSALNLDPGSIIRPWDSGLQVQKLQKALKAMGYDPETEDGTYGYSTMGAVTAFQRAKKLPFSPVLGEGFVTELNRDLVAEEAHPSQDPQMDRAVKYLQDTYLTAVGGGPAPATASTPTPAAQGGGH